jgi:hypothetical protein
VAQQPTESFLGKDLGHAGPVQRRGLGGQPPRRAPLGRTTTTTELAELFNAARSTVYRAINRAAVG